MKGINRYSMTGYAAAKVLIAAIDALRQGADLGLHHRGAGKDQERRNRHHGADQLRPGVRFSNQKLQIMQSEFSTLSFKPVN